MTRPCKCGLGWRPRRLFGFAVEPVDGAPCFFSGLLTLGGCGLPSADKLADCFVAGNGKIQGGARTGHTHGETAPPPDVIGRSAASERSIARSTLRRVMSYSAASLLRGRGRPIVIVSCT